MEFKRIEKCTQEQLELIKLINTTNTYWDLNVTDVAEWISYNKETLINLLLKDENKI